MRVRACLFAVLLAASSLAFSTPQARNATDIWFNAAEPGWGLNLIHQGDTIFASLFVYGPDGQPRWYFASGLTGAGSTYSGPLYESTGSWFGAQLFTRGTPRQVGTMTLAIGDAAATLEYSVDGVRVVKQVTRYTFRRTTLEGRYEGYILQPASGGAPESGRTDLTLMVSDDGSTVTMSTTGDSQAPCVYTGTPSQDGQFEVVSGSYTCGGGATGAWSMRVDPTTEGFTGTFSGLGIDGRIAAARATGDDRILGYGFWNDLWFVAGEDGWGMNVIEQGDTFFVSLFVYDAQGRPRWYSADLRLTGSSDAHNVTYGGPLVESTGPYFGTAFNPAAVTRRAVGELAFHGRPDGRGLSLRYSVDGTHVDKLIERYTFRKENLSGSYFGSYAHDRQALIAIDDDGTDFRMQLADLVGGSGTCNFAAPFVQWGSVRMLSGSFSCTGGESGSFSMPYATVSAHGFTSRFDAASFNFRPIVNGHVAGVRR